MIVATEPQAERERYSVECLSEVRDVAEWDAFVEQHPWGTPGHLASWRRMLQSAFDHIEGRIWVLRDTSTRQLLGGLPVYSVKSRVFGTRLVSVPYFAHADPLLMPKVGDAGLRQLLAETTRRQGDHPHQIKCRYPVSGLNDLGFIQVGRYLHHQFALDPDPEVVWRRLSRKAVRAVIKAAMRMGIEVRVATSLEDARTLHRLALATRRRLGLPPFPRELFDAIWKDLPPERRCIVLASRAGKDIAAVGGLVCGDTFYAEFSGATAKVEASYAVPFAMWEAVRLACESGLRQFSLGRTDPSNEGLLRYKRHWRPEEDELVVWERSMNARNPIPVGADSRSYRAARWLFRHAPAPLYTVLGRAFYSHWG